MSGRCRESDGYFPHWEFPVVGPECHENVQIDLVSRACTPGASGCQAKYRTVFPGRRNLIAPSLSQTITTAEELRCALFWRERVFAD